MIIANNTISQSYSGSAQSSEKGGVDLQEEKSEVYSSNMTQAMGAGESDNVCYFFYDLNRIICV